MRVCRKALLERFEGIRLRLERVDHGIGQQGADFRGERTDVSADIQDRVHARITQPRLLVPGGKTANSARRSQRRFQYVPEARTHAVRISFVRVLYQQRWEVS